MPVYYMVKPEFDQYRVRYCVEDKRTKSGHRIEIIELVGGELLGKKKWYAIISNNPIYSDYFEEVKIPESYIYWSFGCCFSIYDPFDSEDVDNLVHERELKAKQFLVIYEKYLKQNERRWTTIKEKMLIAHLSLDSLNECIKHYSDKLESLEAK